MPDDPTPSEPPAAARDQPREKVTEEYWEHPGRVRHLFSDDRPEEFSYPDQPPKSSYSYRLRSRHDSWGNLLLAIALAGGFFPLVLAATWLVIVVVMTLGQELLDWAGDFQGILFGLGMIPVSAMMLFAFGFIYAGVVCLPVLPSVALSLKLLNWRPRWTQLGVFCGGLVAYICTLPVSLGLFQHGPPSKTGWLWFLITWLMLPGLAIFVGQVGGAIAGIQNERIDRGNPGRQNDSPSALHFSLWQIMAMMAVASFLLTLLRVSGLLTGPMLLATLAWLVLVFLGRRPAIGLAHWYELRKLRKRIARRRAWRGRFELG